jgi:peptide/nickel transport system substrate-binding protein
MRTHGDHLSFRSLPAFRLPVALACLLTLGLTACGGDDDGGDTGAPDATTAPTVPEEIPRGGRVVIGIDAESDGYNPVTNRFAHSGHTVASAVYDTLTTIDADGNIVPHLAESVEAADDEFTVWVITLPEGIEFHNGDPLDADAVVEVFEAHRSSLVTAASMAPVATIEATGSHEVTVSMNQPWAQFPRILDSQIGYVMAPSMLTDPNSAAEPVGTGPFVFDEWDRGSAWRGVRNEDYWRTDDAGNQLPYLDSIEFRMYPDPTQRLDELQRGNLDLIHTLTPSSILTLRDSDFVMVEWDAGENDLISFNTDEPPFDNVHARRALALATDQRRLLTEQRSGVYPFANGPFAPGQLGYEDDTGYPEYDPDEARAELDHWRETEGLGADEPLRFSLTSVDDVAGVRISQYLVDMWAEVGVEAQVEAVAQSDVILRAVTGQYEATRWRNWGRPDPDADYIWWHSSSIRPLDEGISVNIARFADDGIDEALDEARGSEDDGVRDEAYRTVARRMGEEVPYVLLGRVAWAMAGHDQVNGWQVGGQNGTLSMLGSKSWIGEIWVQ